MFLDAFDYRDAVLQLRVLWWLLREKIIEMTR
jgi:hypothetical protein